MANIINDTPNEFGIQSFLTEIEIIRRDKSVSLMDAIIHFCEKNDVEIEIVAQYIKKNIVLKAKIEEEAEELNFIQKTARLPI
jgi:hypothetical protein